MAKRVLVALGGNAIKQPEDKGTFEEQMRNVEIASQQIAQLVKKGYDLVITHGNGPQVGNLAIQQEAALDQVPALPLVALGAMTQGQIGYMMQQSLQNILQGSKQVATVVTQVVVSENDPDFGDPTKPVGPFYTEEEAKSFSTSRGWIMKKVKPSGEKAYRRVVPSPIPLRIVESKAIKKLVEAGIIVIASGGGGIPVLEKNGKLIGIDAVIDKDRAGARLAKAVEANILMILTDVDYAMVDYGKPTQRPLKKLTIAEAKHRLLEGQFGAGSMGPKIEAAIGFVQEGGEKAIITGLGSAVDAIEGKMGTHISIK